MKKAVMYGAGNIGRGFLGQIFSESGYETCFLDTDEALVAELDRRGAYSVYLSTNLETHTVTVRPVRAVRAGTPQAAEEIADCDILATAVGVRALPLIAPALAQGFELRMRRSGRPLDILICENQLDAAPLLRGLILPYLSPELQALAAEKLGLAEVSVGRMVPRMPPEERAKNPLAVRTEPYFQLPADGSAFRGGIPPLKGLQAVSPFDYAIRRKLFLVNGTHALCAYLGAEKGLEYLWQAVLDPDIAAEAEKYAAAAAEALTRKFGESLRQDALDCAAELLPRFGNRMLMDTVARVGADPVRKLRRQDRLTGAALLMLETGVDPAPALRAIRSALKFRSPGDPSAEKLAEMLREQGALAVLKNVLGLSETEELYRLLAEKEN